MKQVVVTGEVKAMEPNDKGGLKIRVRSVHGDGKASNLEFYDLYGKYAETIREKNIIAVGDIVSVHYEEKQVEKLDPDTGERKGFVTFKENITFKRTYRPRSGEKVVTQSNNNSSVPNTDTY